MGRLRWIFRNEQRLRAGWRVAIFIGLYIVAGKGLEALFTRFALPSDFTWQGTLVGTAFDFATVCALAWIMSKIEHESFSAYGLPLVPDAGKLLAKGLL